MRKSRERAGYSIAVMAEHFGVHRNQVGRWEADRSKPKRHVVIQWALVTQVPLAWLEGESVPTPPPTGGERVGSRAKPMGGRRPAASPGRSNSRWNSTPAAAKKGDPSRRSTARIGTSPKGPVCRVAA